eukprot:3006540-Rhodomonas_salina.1
MHTDIPPPSSTCPRAHAQSLPCAESHPLECSRAVHPAPRSRLRCGKCTASSPTSSITATGGLYSVKRALPRALFNELTAHALRAAATG